MEGIAKRLGYSAEVARPTENGRNYFKKALFHFLQLLVVRRPVRDLREGVDLVVARLAAQVGVVAGGDEVRDELSQEILKASWSLKSL